MKEVRVLADLDSIYRQNADIVFRFLMSMTGSADLSEELTQETFYQAVRSINRYDGSSRVSTWLCGIAKNVWLADQRKRKMESPALDDVPERTVNSAEESFLEKADVKAILAAIDEHPEPGKEVLRLRLLGGLSFRQIGDAMGKTETWARVTYYRAKQNIVKELDQDE